MEAHLVLGNAGLTVASYGTGSQVRLPGRTAMEPRIFRFGTPYRDMYMQLSATPSDAQYFGRNGVLQLCRRGASVKISPTRWQDEVNVSQHNIVVRTYYCPSALERCNTNTLFLLSPQIAFEVRCFFNPQLLCCAARH